MTFGVIATRALSFVGIDVAKSGIDYASKAVTGHIAIAVLDNTVESAASQGKNVAGSIGESAGRILGKAIAGQVLPCVVNEADSLRSAVTSLGIAAVEHAAVVKEAQEQPPSNSKNLIPLAFKVAGVIAAGSAIAAFGVPAAAVGLVAATAQALPKIVQAATANPLPANKKIDFVEDVVVGASKAMAIEAAGLFVGNVVRYEQVKGAYNLRAAQGEQVGKAIGHYLPQTVQNYLAKAGQWLGAFDAGRYALSPEVLASANAAGDTAEKMVKGSLKFTDAFVANKISEQGAGISASKVAWIAAGIAGACTLVAIAPEAAPVIAATAMLGVADKVIMWAKGSGVQSALPILPQENSPENQGLKKQPC